MGNVCITINAVGCHHNGTKGDIDQLAYDFVAELKKLGHHVVNANLTHGGGHDLLDLALRYPVRGEGR